MRHRDFFLVHAWRSRGHCARYAYTRN